ncbi:MAG: bifunctional UDP-N-acetylglucosamine diphosphorylase/glucosamine-1-phosphate N-acetyltransferase GlmU [Firmicutes bacterium]|nr:bifunctional UDP-N-acetylglucosamine diphosphorylase/glucosamine-1-phosphate N-acetyltransferase GlmU [Bacillota bacterium]
MNCKTAVILAAGAGTRMKSEKPKVLHEICGKPMVSHVTSQAAAAGSENIIIVVGHGADKVQSQLADQGLSFALQTEQLGTGHAVMMAKDQIPDEGDVFVLCGDTPLITAETLKKFAAYHTEKKNAVTVLTAVFENPFGYGRIIRGADDQILKIVEQKDASEEEKAVKEVNAGMYCMNAVFLKSNITKLSSDNAQNEYYITDLIAMAVESGNGAGAYIVEDSDEIMGVNNRVQLSQASDVMRKRIAEKHMVNGVTIIDPSRVYIEDDVVIGNDTEIWPGAVLKGKTVIGKGCMIGADCQIENSTVGDGTDILKSVIKDSSIGENTHVGPFAYLRPGSEIGSGCKIGDFVEVKKARMGDGSKASHLAYIGDADIGEDVNIGCGVIFANYDGVHKFRSTAGDRAFIGSNSNLVAPVNIGADAYVAAGTTVTVDVPEGALCVGRSREVIEEGWVEKKGLSKKKR